MPSERRWSDEDRELVRAVLHEADYYDDEAAAAVLDALTAAGWQSPPPPAAGRACQVPDEFGRPVCVRDIGQRPCETCPHWPADG